MITEKLSKRYGKSSMALQDVSFSAPSSGILALIGRNGAGKTTLVRILATELAPTSGSASINGIDVVREDKRLRERIAIVPQEARTISWMTPKQSTLTYLMWRGFEYSEAKKRAEESLARLKLDKFADTLNRKLSGGTKRKALAAMVLASEADIIFLDEPTTGLDPISRRDFWEILRELAKDRFIFLTTHYLEEAEQLADTLAVLGGGRLVAVGHGPVDPRAGSGTSTASSCRRTPPSPRSPKGEVTTGKNGEVQILTNEDEAFAISKKLSVAGSRFSIGPVSLDDIFFQLVGESTHGEQEAATPGARRGVVGVKRSLSSQLVAAILVNSVYEMKNYPINLVNTVLSPLSFLVVIDFVSKGALIGQAIEGGLIMSMFQSGMSLQGDISHLKNDFKLQDMLVSSPASPAVYVIGMAASEIIYNLPALAILVVLGGIYIHPGAVQAARADRRPGPHVPHLHHHRVHVRHPLERHRPELRVVEAPHHHLHRDNARLLPDNVHPAPVQVPGVPLADHLRGGDNAERGRVAQAQRGRQ